MSENRSYSKNLGHVQKTYFLIAQSHSSTELLRHVFWTDIPLFSNQAKNIFPMLSV